MGRSHECPRAHVINWMLVDDWKSEHLGAAGEGERTGVISKEGRTYGSPPFGNILT